ncbi:MAG: c-type cytochrome [Bryobacteraceae bacterium]|nr:c-type cytochrome [Bryobacteraceae bacterium]
MRALVFFVFALPLAAQHGRYLNESQHPAIGNPQAIAAGAKLYNTSCSGCHGPDGSGGRGPNLVRRSLWHPLSDEAIFKAIRNGVAGADMPPTKLEDDQTWNLVAYIHAISGPASENTIPGNPESGAKIFFSSKAGCANCHSIRGQGGRMGPDLSNVGGSRPLAVIRESVVEPSKDLSLLGNEGVTVTLHSGQVIKGIARNRSNYAMQVVDGKGRLHLLNMIDVKELSISGKSPMPGDYASRLSKQELTDLLAYLASQSLRAKDSAYSRGNE